MNDLLELHVLDDAPHLTRESQHLFVRVRLLAAAALIAAAAAVGLLAG